MTLEKKMVLTLTEKERDFLLNFYESIIDEFDNINFTFLLCDIACKSSTHTHHDVSIDIKYEEE